MLKLIPYRFLFLTLSVLAGSARAEITLGNATYQGTGCPPGSVEIVSTPDQTALSVLYSQFSVQVAPRKSTNKICSVKVPILNIPYDKMVLISQSDFQGFVSLPRKGAFATFKGESILRRKGQLIGYDIFFKKVFAPFADNFYTDRLKKFGLKSGCGGSAELEIKTRIGIVNPTKESASFTIDTSNLVSDSESPLRINLAYCRP